MEWITFLSQPLTQIGALVGVLAGLQKLGLNVTGSFQSLFGGSNTEELKQLIQGISESQLHLRNHYNDETTELLKDIKLGIQKHDERHEESSQLIKEIAKYGVRCRKE